MSRWLLGLIVFLGIDPPFVVGQTSKGLPLDEGWCSTWRQGGFDAVTSLYIFFRIEGIPVQYQDLATDNRLRRRCSFANVLSVARELGANVSLRKCTITELQRMPLPLLLHLDSDRDSSGGEFVVLINRSGESWISVRGSSGTIHTLKHDELFRHWSGYVMNTNRHTSIWYILAAVFSGWPLGIVFGRAIRSFTH